MLKKEINRLIKIAFQEDAPQGDITSNYFCHNKTKAQAKIIAKAAGILCGIDIAETCFKKASPWLRFEKLKKDGTLLKKGDIVASLEGPIKAVLLAERSALNFLQLLSGIATATNNLVNKVKSTKVKILDTRKTIPGLRYLSKYAVRCGGGANHRLNLSDMILIKDNHLAKLSLPELKKHLEKVKRKNIIIKIEIEAESLEQVRNFLSLPVDIIMLDNMSPAQIRKAVTLRDKINPAVKLEASGNINKKNILAIARCGIDFISSGSITHSFAAFDFSLKIKPL